MLKKIDKIIANLALKPAPNTMQVHNTIWTKDDEDTLYLNYLLCFYCICNKLYYPPYLHFSLPTNWTVKRKFYEKQIKEKVQKPSADERSEVNKRSSNKSRLANTVKAPVNITTTSNRAKQRNLESKPNNKSSSKNTKKKRNIIKS